MESLGSMPMPAPQGATMSGPCHHVQAQHAQS